MKKVTKKDCEDLVKILSISVPYGFIVEGNAVDCLHNGIKFDIERLKKD